MRDDAGAVTTKRRPRTCRARRERRHSAQRPACGRWQFRWVRSLRRATRDADGHTDGDPGPSWYKERRSAWVAGLTCPGGGFWRLQLPTGPQGARESAGSPGPRLGFIRRNPSLASEGLIPLTRHEFTTPQRSFPAPQALRSRLPDPVTVSIRCTPHLVIVEYYNIKFAPNN